MSVDSGLFDKHYQGAEICVCKGLVNVRHGYVTVREGFDGFIDVQADPHTLNEQILGGPDGSRPGDIIQPGCVLHDGDSIKHEWQQQVTFWLGRHVATCGTGALYGGESLLYPHSDRLPFVSADRANLRVMFLRNAQTGSIAGVCCHLTAPDRVAAEIWAFGVVNTILSALSYQYRVPTVVERVEVVDFTTTPPHFWMTVTKPFQQTTVDLFSYDVPDALQDSSAWNRAMAFYRDSLLITVPMYRFLALYKALWDLDGTMADLNGGRETKIRVVQPILPSDSFLTYYFPELAGKKVQEGRKALKVEYRNAVAHNVLYDGTSVTSNGRYGIVHYSILTAMADRIFRLMADAIIGAVSRSSQETSQ